jgi:Protein of unknown function (DUF1566)
MNILAQSGAVRRRVAVACGVLASFFVCGSAAAQFGPIIELPPGLPTLMPAVPYPPTVAPTAAGIYYAPPAWIQTLAPNVRFVILSNFNRDAVLDRETGLVWLRRNGDEFAARFANCGAYPETGQTGWRLPSASELQSLIDASLPISAQPRLPVGHPFLLTGRFYWASDIKTLDPFGSFRTFVDLTSGFTANSSLENSNVTEVALCVRGR